MFYDEEGKEVGAREKAEQFDVYPLGFVGSSVAGFWLGTRYVGIMYSLIPVCRCNSHVIELYS